MAAAAALREGQGRRSKLSACCQCIRKPARALCMWRVKARFQSSKARLRAPKVHSLYAPGWGMTSVLSICKVAIGMTSVLPICKFAFDISGNCSKLQ